MIMTSAPTAPGRASRPNVQTSRPDDLDTRKNVVRILAVDDSVQAREFLCLKLPELAPAGFELEIVTASSGQEGIDLCKEEDFDLIFLDVEMPGINGFDTCREVRQLTKARIVMLTSKSMAEDFQAGNKAGCNHYLLKPPNDADVRVILLLTSMKKI